VVSDPSTAVSTVHSLQELKECLVFHIYRIHLLILSCRKCVEECIIANNKPAAFLVKGKEVILRNKIEGLQNLVREIDEISEKDVKDKYLQKRLVSDGNEALRKMSTALFMNDLEVLVNCGNEIIKDYVKIELQAMEMSEKSLSLKLEQEFQKQKVFENKRHFVRRKYSKEVTASEIPIAA
jgi:hypothetical protein